VTSELFIPRGKAVKAVLIAKEPCTVCGLEIAGMVLKAQDRAIRFKPLVKDGAWVQKGRVIARISGRARSILTAERVTLNFLSLLSGVATKTRAYVEAVKPHKARVMDTRKTIPGLRILQKYAVQIGGGTNHRMGLDEMIMLKDNHLCLVDLKQSAKPARVFSGAEIEAESLAELRQALTLKPAIIMLDNMSIKEMKTAVSLRNRLEPGVKLEASGGITLSNIKQIAATGVDMISVGSLTHTVDSADISLEIET
jgi:nicotinate-nucleotide pyrophosphorylase (carboxylating)